MPETTLKRTIEEVLGELGLLSPNQLELLKSESKKTGKPAETLVKELRLVSEEDLAKARASALVIPYVNLTGRHIDDETLSVIPYKLAEQYSAVCFSAAADTIEVAMIDPTNLQVIDFLEKRTGKKIKAYLSSASSVEAGLSQYRGGATIEVQEALRSVEVVPTETAADLASVKKIVEDAPVTKAVNTILEFAITSRATDIHIEPREKNLHIRYRIDGILHEAMTLSLQVHPAIISRIKILANLKIDEHRVPQDGGFEVRFGEREVDVRVAVSPQIWGEKVVLRLLDKSGKEFTLEKLGLVGRSFRRIKEGMQKPFGLILITGPTGSGKSTTLYALLKELNLPEVNIITIEDPVEYKIDGVNQIQINPQVGLTFATALRSILRQDPNVVMVGEIRDEETAELAVHASLTGHRVFTTLHTNTSAGILPRLLDMGVEAYLIASTVRIGAAQRLIRVLCPHCKEPVAASKIAVKAINDTIGALLPKTKAEAARAAENLGYANLPLQSQTSYTLFQGRGCAVCNFTGYLGRIGIYEAFSMSPRLEALLLSRPTIEQVNQLVTEEGMITLAQDGYLKALVGISTLAEVHRVAGEAQEEL